MFPTRLPFLGWLRQRATRRCILCSTALQGQTRVLTALVRAPSVSLHRDRFELVGQWVTLAHVGSGVP